MEVLRVLFTWLVKFSFWGATGLLAIGVAVERSPWWLTGFGLFWLGSLPALGKYKMSWSAIIPHLLCNAYFLYVFSEIVTNKNSSVWWLIVALILDGIFVGHAQSKVDEEEKKNKKADNSQAQSETDGKKVESPLKKTVATEEFVAGKSDVAKQSKESETAHVESQPTIENASEKEDSIAAENSFNTGEIQLSITSMRRIENDLSFLLPGCRSNGINFIGAVKDHFYAVDHDTLYSSSDAIVWKREGEITASLSENASSLYIKRIVSFQDTTCFITSKNFYLLEDSGIKKIPFSFGEINDISCDGDKIYILSSRKEDGGHQFYICQGNDFEKFDKIKKLPWGMGGEKSSSPNHPKQVVVFKGTFMFLLENFAARKMNLVTSKTLDDFTCTVDEIVYDGGVKIIASGDICYLLMGSRNNGYYYTKDGEVWNACSREMKDIFYNGNLYVGFVHDVQDELLLSQDGIQWRGVTLWDDERIGNSRLAATEDHIFFIADCAWVVQAVLGKCQDKTDKTMFIDLPAAYPASSETLPVYPSVDRSKISAFKSAFLWSHGIFSMEPYFEAISMASEIKESASGKSIKGIAVKEMEFAVTHYGDPEARYILAIINLCDSYSTLDNMMAITGNNEFSKGLVVEAAKELVDLLKINFLPEKKFLFILNQIQNLYQKHPDIFRAFLMEIRKGIN